MKLIAKYSNVILKNLINIELKKHSYIAVNIFLKGQTLGNYNFSVHQQCSVNPWKKKAITIVDIINESTINSSRLLIVELYIADQVRVLCLGMVC